MGVVICALLPIAPRLTRAVREDFARRQEDVAIFFRTRRALFQGDGEPYPLGRGAPNLNPPHAHILFVPLLSRSREGAYMAWLCVSAMALLLVRGLIVHILPERPDIMTLLLAAALVSGSGLAMASAASGQVYGVLALPLTWAWLAHREQENYVVGAIVGVLMTVKPSLAVLVAGWARVGIERRCRPPSRRHWPSWASGSSPSGANRTSDG